MNTKLTLSLDKEIIEKAKLYARKKNSSLSALIENYLVSVTNDRTAHENDITPLVKSLSGVLKPDEKTSYKKGYSDYLAGKYK